MSPFSQTSKRFSIPEGTSKLSELPKCFFILIQKSSTIIFAMRFKKVIRFGMQAQSATEYLLTLVAVLLAFSGVAVLFSNQVNGYLSMLFKVLTLPF